MVHAKYWLNQQLQYTGTRREEGERQVRRQSDNSCGVGRRSASKGNSATATAPTDRRPSPHSGVLKDGQESTKKNPAQVPREYVWHILAAQQIVVVLTHFLIKLLMIHEEHTSVPCRMCVRYLHHAWTTTDTSLNDSLWLVLLWLIL